jgi:hypothetical protein
MTDGCSRIFVVGWSISPLPVRLVGDRQQQIYTAYQTINRTPGVTPGNGLQPPETATTVRVQDGKTITTDGPLVDTKGALNGHLVYGAGDLDGAIDLAQIPAASWFPRSQW